MSYVRYSNFPGYADLPYALHVVDLIGIQAIVGECDSEDLLAIAFVDYSVFPKGDRQSVHEMQNTLQKRGLAVCHRHLGRMLRTLKVRVSDRELFDSYLTMAFAAEESGVAAHQILFANAAKEVRRSRCEEIRFHGRLFARVVGLIELERGSHAADLFAATHLAAVIDRMKMAPAARRFVEAVYRPFTHKRAA